MDLNDKPKILDHDFRLTRPIAKLKSRAKQNEIAQHIANGFAAVINTASAVKTDHLNIWHKVKDGPYMDDRLQVPGSERPDTTLKNLIESFNKTEDNTEGNLEKTQVTFYLVTFFVTKKKWCIPLIFMIDKNMA